MRLRSSLVLLVIASALPLAGLAILTSILLVEHEQENFVTAVKGRNRAFMSAVDAELQGEVTALTTLTALPNLSRGDLRALHDDLVAVKAAQPRWLALILHDPAGRQLVNTLVPPGEALPDAVDPQSVRAAAETKRPVIGGMTQRRGYASTFGIPVRVPIVRNGRVVYVLTGVTDPAVFQRLMEDQQLPQGWVSGLVDRDYRFVARVPPTTPGSFASADFRKATSSDGEGWYRGHTLEGSDTYTAFYRSAFSGWAVGFAVPSDVVLAGAHRAGWALGIASALCIALALAVAFWLGRRIAVPIAGLVKSLPALGTDGHVVPVSTAIQEVHALGEALDRASVAIREREQVAELERRVLAESDRAKDQFIAMLSHEMRNPLAALTAASLVLRASAKDDVGVNAHAVIERQTAQLTRLVEDLLDASRIAMNKVTLEREPVDLAELAASVGRTFEAAGRLKDHAFTLQSAPAWVSGDRGRLEQVLSNLLDNALKFTPRGGSVAVSVRPRGDEACVEVSDSGAGLEAEELSRVFGLFVQGQQGLNRGQGGMGLGLALVKRLVELHGGTVAAESDGIGEGTRFTVCLPRIDAPSHADAAAARHPQRNVRTILLVEDSDDAREMLAMVLQLRGHTVFVAANGESALRLAEQHHPDTAIIDIGLPGMDGYAVARALRNAPGHVALLIALTGYGQPADVERAREAGFDVHLTKPATFEEIEAVFHPERRPV